MSKTTNEIMNNSLGEITTNEVFSFRYNSISNNGLYSEKVFGPVSLTFEKIEDNDFYSISDKEKKYPSDVFSINAHCRSGGYGHFELTMPTINSILFNKYKTLIADLINISSLDLKRIVECKEGIVFKDNRVLLGDYYVDTRQFVGGIAVVKIFQFLKGELENGIQFMEINHSNKQMVELIKKINDMDYDCFQSNPFIIGAIPVINPNSREIGLSKYGSLRSMPTHISYFSSKLNDGYRKLIDADKRIKHMVENPYFNMWKPLDRSYWHKLEHLQEITNKLLNFDEFNSILD